MIITRTEYKTLSIREETNCSGRQYDVIIQRVNLERIGSCVYDKQLLGKESQTEIGKRQIKEVELWIYRRQSVVVSSKQREV